MSFAPRLPLLLICKLSQDTTPSLRLAILHVSKNFKIRYKFLRDLAGKRSRN